ncbi:hypothetical protein L7F22_063648 [Adiantum nelumboides]|nr:hypothetical protein [Adiantum nelumboides]
MASAEAAAFALMRLRVLLRATACLLLMIAAASCRGGVEATDKLEMVLYIHINPGVTNTAILNATSGNPRFGSLTAFDLPVSSELDATSKSLGFLRGLGILFNDTVDSTLVLEQLLSTLYYDDGGSSGTLALHALIDSRFSGLPTELAVVGGTGDFRFANGYASIVFVSSSGSVALQYSVSIQFAN